MPTVTLRSGNSFTSEPGQSLIDAAELSGTTLPHSCRTGRCSSCKCKIFGSTGIIFDEIGLSAEEKADGWVLACARSAQGDVILDIQDLSLLNLPKSITIPARIEALELLSQDIVRVRLRLPPGRKMEFLAGQYADVIGPGGVRRSYSFAAAQQSGAVEFHIRRVEGGAMSAYWFEAAKINDLLRLYGPKGTFVLRHTSQTDLVFLATGTGIAPVKAMLEELATVHPDQRPRSISLFWGGRTEADLYWEPCRIFDQVEYVPVLSRADASWRGARGHVQEAFLATARDLEALQIYACGSEAMIHSARRALTARGLTEGAFFSDAFVASN